MQSHATETHDSRRLTPNIYKHMNSGATTNAL